ncbi:MAG: cytochrome P450 [Alphaproteobacteria bacterium]|nr:MAG: cytochrome P450 [Alphaproteobacteria bacterium]
MSKAPAARASPPRSVIPGPPEPLSLLDIRSDPLQFIRDLTARHGDIVAYRAPGWSAVLVNRPEFVRHVLLENFRNYGKEGTPDLMMLKPMLGDGLLTSSGATWKRQRQTLQPVFHPAAIRQYVAVMIEATESMLDRWEARGAAASFDLVPAMSDLTLRIVARALFGYDVAPQSDRFGTAVEDLNETMGHLDPTDAATARRFAKALAVVRETVTRVIQDESRDATADDALAVMLRDTGIASVGEAVARAEVVDQVLTLLLAGHETTAKALAWTLYLLATHQDAERTVLQEIADTLGDRTPTAETTERMPYAWAVIQESARLYPPIWLMSRRALDDDEIGGYRIAAGTLVVFSPFLLHRRADLWPQPETFRPERFLGEADHGAVSEFSYLPFSGGPRHCVGKHFAALEMRIVLPLILRRFSVRLRAGHPVEPQALVTLRPRYGLPVTAVKRTRNAGANVEL